MSIHTSQGFNSLGMFSVFSPKKPFLKFQNILWLLSTSVLTIESKLFDRNQKLSINQKRPYVTDNYSWFDSGILSHLTESFFVTPDFLKKKCL